MTTGSFYGTPNPLSGASAAPIISNRAPTTLDRTYSIGQWWIFEPSGQLYYLANITNGDANWIVVASGPGSVNTINFVGPAAGNINLVDQGGAGAIAITAPGSGGANSIGLAVKVDGVTIQIIGDQLVAVAAVPALTLTGDAGGPQPYLANNFNIQGGAAGAIVFTSAAPGQMNAQVQVDNTTITINGSDQLQTANTTFGTVTTVGAVTLPVLTVPLGATPGTYTFEIDVAGYITAGPDAPASVGYTLVGAVRTTGAAAVLLPGQELDEFEEVPFSTTGCQLSVAGNNAVVNVTGLAGDTINWKGKQQFIFQG